MKIAIGGIITALLTTTVKSSNKELGLVLTLCACAILLIPGLRMLEDLKELMHQLREESGLESAVLTSLVRVCAIGIITQISVYFCQDAGESSIAKVLEFCGSIAAVYVAIPLMELVLNLLKSFLGG